MRSTLWQAGLAAALTAALYVPGLAVSPPHLLHDEIRTALQAKSLADTGRDLNGRVLAVYFPEPGYAAGRDPICIYVTAAVLAVLPFSEASIRLPSALVGALGVGLAFVLAHRLFGRMAIAWIVAVILALTPTYYIHSRLGLSVIYPVPFVLLWLITLARYLAEPRVSTASWCGVVLGLGVYSYLAAALMMPLYLLVTLAVLATRREWRAAAGALAGFAALLVPIAVWQLAQPNRYADIATAYRLFDASPAPDRGVIEGIGAFVRQRLDILWDSFNPSRLFFTGESSLHISTREVGSFLLPVAVFIAWGIRELVRERRGPMGWVLLFGLVSAPLPAVIMVDVEIRRWLVVIPFAVAVAGYGVDRLLRSGRWSQLVCVLLLAAMPLQFALFARDYFGPYRERASFWFGGNIRAALETVLDEVEDRPAPAVYISDDIPWVEAYWRFYATLRRRPELVAHARYLRFRPGETPPPAPDGVAVAPAEDPNAAAALERAGWVARHLVRDLDGKPAFIVYGHPGA